MKWHAPWVEGLATGYIADPPVVWSIDFAALVSSFPAGEDPCQSIPFLQEVTLKFLTACCGDVEANVAEKYKRAVEGRAPRSTLRDWETQPCIALSLRSQLLQARGKQACFRVWLGGIYALADRDFHVEVRRFLKFSIWVWKGFGLHSIVGVFGINWTSIDRLVEGWFTDRTSWWISKSFSGSWVMLAPLLLSILEDIACLICIPQSQYKTLKKSTSCVLYLIIEMSINSGWIHNSHIFWTRVQMFVVELNGKRKESSVECRSITCQTSLMIRW